jgi:phosphatidylserine decarboxylase
MSERLFILLQHLTPKLLLTRFAGWVATGQWGWITQRIIGNFVARYQVNMAEAANPHIDSYASFNEFFTRPLRADARPLAAQAWVCPVDGAVSQLGPITGDAGDQIFQAKGHSYSTTALLGGDAALAAQFAHGQFATIYLSPRDYHRIHMPQAGRLQRMVHVPGELFSVNPATARGVPGLFARNERLVCVFESPGHSASVGAPFVMVLVGATIVGSMATVWHGLVNPPRPGAVRSWDYSDQNITLAQGEEMGRFLLGSTVVLLAPKNALRFNPDWAAERAVRLGEGMGDGV